jgi:uncharacterized membrane protein
MSTFIVSIFSDEAKAYDAVRALNELHMEGSISVYDTSVVQRKPGGQLEVKQRGPGAAETTGIGALIGALVGMFGGPLGIAVGAAAGTALGGTTALVRGDTSDEFLEDIARTMKPGDFAVLADVSETWTAPIDTRIQALGGTVLREKRSDYVDTLMEKRAEAFKSAVQERKTEHASHKAERMQGRLDDYMYETRERLQRMADKVHDRLDSTKAEMQRKLGALEEQAKKAEPDVKQQIEQHITDIRNDFTERERKLSHAYELAQEALQP